MIPIRDTQPSHTFPVVTYLLMGMRFVQHLTFSFPELLLVILAIILMIGQYNGYRLSELQRFSPMVKE